MKVYQDQNIRTYKEMAKLSFTSFLLTIPNLIICAATAISTGTVLVWVDTVVSVGETVHSFLVADTSRKMVKETGDKYNFGMGRLEVFISFACNLVISIGMLAVLVGAIFNLIYPASEQSSLLLFCLLKCFNCTYDYLVYRKEVRICKEHPSKLNQTETNAYRAALIQDACVGIAAVVCHLLRQYDFALYISPIFSIVLSIVLLKGYITNMYNAVNEITDVSIPVKSQDEIYDIVMENHEYIRKIVSVNCRKLNDRPHIEISLIFKEDTSYTQIEKYLSDMKEKIRKVVPDAEILLVLGEE